jgi:hypothetical protein
VFFFFNPFRSIDFLILSKRDTHFGLWLCYYNKDFPQALSEVFLNMK